MQTDGYLATVARNVGVPEMWVEDAIQELRIAEWQQRRLSSAAIDFVRRVGPRSRYGTSREYAYIDGHERLSPDWTATSDALLDLESSFEMLKAGERAALVRFYVGIEPESRDWRLRYFGRQKLRKAA